MRHEECESRKLLNLYVVVGTFSEHKNKSDRATFFLGSMKRKFVDLMAVSNPPRSFYFTIIAIFIEYPEGASAEERETGG